MMISSPINTSNVSCVKTSTFSLQRTESNDCKNDTKHNTIFSQLYASQDGRSSEPKQQEQHEKRRDTLVSAPWINYSPKCLLQTPIRRQISNDSTRTISSSSTSSDRTNDSVTSNPTKGRVRFDCRNNQVKTIEPLFHHTNEIWWKASELKEFHHMTQINDQYHNLRNKENINKCDDNDDPLKTFLLAYYVIREEFAAVFKETDEATTKRSFADLSKKHQQRIIDGLDVYGYHGIEIYIGDDASKRRQNIRRHVHRTVAYYKLKKDHLVSTVDTSGDGNGNSFDDRLSHSVRKVAESNSRQDRYWARFMGQAACKVAKP